MVKAGLSVCARGEGSCVSARNGFSQVDLENGRAVSPARHGGVPRFIPTDHAIAGRVGVCLLVAGERRLFVAML